MAVIGLILKVLLGILITLLLVVLVCIVILLFFPIEYDVEYEKYSTQQIKVFSKIFFVLGIRYTYTEDNSFIKLSFCGITIKEIQLTPKEEEKVEEDVETDAKSVANKATKDVAKNVQVLDNAKKGQTSVNINNKTNTEKSNTNKNINKNVKHNVDANKTEDHVEQTSKKTSSDKVKKAKKQRSKQSKIKDLYELIKKLWTSADRNAFFKAVGHLLLDIIKSIRPKVFWFDIIIGKENPAETGELIAKLSMAYPLYAPFGIIQGDYNEAGFWGEVQAKGKFNVYQLLKPVVIFGLNKQVRDYIKIILNVRKVEEYGV